METKAHLLHTAQILFTQFGLKKITTDDIAREARVSKATIYRYFNNKTEVFDEVVLEESKQLLAAINEAVAVQTQAIDKLRAHLLTRLQKVGEFVNFYRVTRESWGDYWPHIAQVSRKYVSQEKDIVRKILEQGVATGELRIDNVELAAHVLVVALASVEYQWTSDEQDIPLEILVDTMLTMIADGIRRK